MKILSKISQLDECVLQNSYHMENRVTPLTMTTTEDFLTWQGKVKLSTFSENITFLYQGSRGKPHQLLPAKQIITLPLLSKTVF